jgi:NAD-dependent dihydropyrimidine dehydrogenase PreA subunit
MVKYLKNVATLELDLDRCVGCMLCTQACPHGVFRAEANKAIIQDRDACMECGACALNCPVDAIAVDSGVGCALAMIVGALRGTEPTCDCRGGSCA